jgi:hypothetical protein
VARDAGQDTAVTPGHIPDSATSHPALSEKLLSSFSQPPSSAFYFAIFNGIWYC